MVSSKKFDYQEACARGNDNKKRKHEDVFKEGTLIEVHPVEEGFEGAWFSAKVIHALKEETYLVRYKKLRTEDNRDFLIEEVHKNNIRPYPSEHIVIDGFRRHDKVDAFCNDGWWEGIISKVYAGGRYKVYFESTNEEMVFDYTDLRLHTHWVNGNWYDFLSLISNFLPSIMRLYISFPFLGYDLYVSFIGTLNLLHLLNLMACLDVILLEVV